MREPRKGLGAPGKFVQVGNQDGTRHRLDEEVIGSQIQNAGDNGGFIQGGKDKDRYAAKGPRCLAYLPAVHVWHHEIQDDNSGRMLADHPKAIPAAVGDHHLKTGGFQERGKQLGDGRIIVYGQYKRVHILAHDLLSWIYGSLNFASYLQIDPLACDIRHL